MSIQMTRWRKSSSLLNHLLKMGFSERYTDYKFSQWSWTATTMEKNERNTIWWSCQFVWGVSDTQVQIKNKTHRINRIIKDSTLIVVLKAYEIQYLCIKDKIEQSKSSLDVYEYNAESATLTHERALETQAIFWNCNAHPSSIWK